ncbi:DUF3040 domain-containing protein [Saccharopolyspora aridisoli]|uniref:DUF3040 domain-containing protein n=1 Tax=Saccharopolyspora aridisoli TaxID=2530385 RepID=A0A4R4USX8_9PSEU|nr:DUF3040 domain-containing protein [Saccharopolyspora aridisoli]TDC95488.1 DUF3040 domain-containing protein [Saccharopolyspora aridisoli]
MRSEERRRLRAIESGLYDEDPGLARKFDDFNEGVPAVRRYRVEFAVATSMVLTVCAGLCLVAGLFLGGLVLGVLALLIAMMTVANREHA